MVADPDRSVLDAFWQDAASHLGLDQVRPAGHFHFGDTAELANALAGEVLNGPKRATAGLVAEMEADGETAAKPGEYWIVIDGDGAPRAIIQTLELRQRPFHTVDEAFAWDEGEFDRSLASWRAAHIDYFQRSCRRIGIDFAERLDVIFERFDVVWPKAAFDRPLLRHPCTENQWAAYHRLRRSLFEHYVPDIPYDPDYPENWTRDTFHLGLVSGGDLLGCLQMRWLSSAEASFQLVAVQEQWRGRGIGRTMLSEGEAFARANGRRLIRVFAESEAENFYRRLGFEDDPDGVLTPLSARARPLKKALTVSPRKGGP